MTSAHTDSLAFRYPARVPHCTCLICTRAGAENKASDYTDPHSIFNEYRIVKIDPNNHRAIVELNHTDYTELHQLQQSNTRSDTNYTLYDSPVQQQIWYQGLHKLVKSLMKDKKASAFCTPVDPVLLNIPDYYTIIKHPMDLSAVLQQLENGTYTDPDSVISDIRMIWRNAFVYNKPEHPVSQSARDMSIKFETALLGM